MEQKQLNWMETGISNDFMFYYVMRDNPDICLELLQAIFPELGIKGVEFVETQRVLDEAFDTRGVRLDVYTEDAEGRAYDVEMQAVNKGNIRKRSRYNQSMMDMNQLSKSMDFDELKQSFVIFICNFDLFGKGQYIYTFENVCKEDSRIKLNDGVKKVFINAKGNNGIISDKLRCFLKLVSEKSATDDFTQKIQEAIDFIHLNGEVRNAYMTLEMKIAEECKYARAEAIKEGREEGREQGRAEGREEGREQMLALVKMMTNDGLEIDVDKLLDADYLNTMLAKYELL